MCGFFQPLSHAPRDSTDREEAPRSSQCILGCMDGRHLEYMLQILAVEFVLGGYGCSPLRLTYAGQTDELLDRWREN